ncbi:hypothetical protein KVR01_009161 [Diaporthe batatas]|uniref:uncharacterized protein n=1 Tax=Diaporthe batatas TaxID=748121 RepID=UPI001D04AB67|nr:uncharacterized protein KVR01_009161 [Diaporthe batatas]KAG8160897.1 hypothetical protein KVR01_009161 [Diaporthe batatas]
MAKRRCTPKRASMNTIAAFPPGESLLELLPSEIHLEVFKHLAPAHFTLKYTKDHQAHRAALRNLCLVSKKMDALARGELYSDLRMYSIDRAIRIFAMLLTNPQLTGHVKSILLFPSQKPTRKDSLFVDLTPLRSLNDPDFAYWTTGGDLARVEMPAITGDKMVYNLLYKTLSRTPALQAVYIRLPGDYPHGYAPHADQRVTRGSLDLSKQLDGLRLDTSISKLPRLKTVGILGGGSVLRKSLVFEDLIRVFQSLLRSPNLVEVSWVGLTRDPSWMTTKFWDAPLLTSNTVDLLVARPEFNQVSASVKKINLRGIEIVADNIEALTRAFPSMEALTIEDDCYISSDIIFRMWVIRLPKEAFNPLMRSDNLHTFVFDNYPFRLGSGRFSAATTGWHKTVDLSALPKLQTLVVPLDFFAYFTEGENRLIQQATAILPGSLRRVILLLHSACKERLAKQFTRKSGVEGTTREFMQELAATLLVEFPHIDKVDVCYHIEHYRQNKVFTLADRSKQLEVGEEAARADSSMD